VSGDETQDSGSQQGQPQPQQPAPQPGLEVPAPHAPSEEPNWVAPDYGISWATRTAVPPTESEEHT
jgi:hypothetical protein